MKESLLRASVLMSLLMACAVSAGPLLPAKVPAGAKWIVHVDMELFLKAKFGQAVFQQSPQGTPVSLPKEMQSLLANQKPSDLRGLTLFGDGVSQENIVAIIDVAYNQEVLVAKLKERPGYTTETVGTHVLHLSAPQNPAQADPQAQRPTADQAVVCLFDANTVVVGPGKPALLFVLDVMDGKEAGAAGSAEWEGLAVTPTAFLSTRLRHMDIPPEMINPGNQARIAMLTSISALRTDFGETEDLLSFSAMCDADKPESAVQIQQFVAGMVSLLMFQGAQVPELAKLTQGIKLGVNDKTVTLDCKLPVTEAIALLNQRNRLFQGMAIPNAPPAQQ
ncbi:MAG: hypothetical protein A3K18_30365 [Lentisphaerae bacterium RIFOXYA12_64_32]|nr:MAG: hypothetical protein A3K18_30365 [Lentisphaerae bacterium RIFOXYA12_64_32]